MTVTKAFNTRTRRFPLGATVTVADDLSPFTREDLEARGFLASPDTTAARRPPRKPA